MFFNKKGQAFDVFKLLIAAIIAIAILVVLLPLLRPPVLPGNDPIGGARTLISDLANKPALPRTSQPVIFAAGVTINSRGIAEGSSGVVTEEGVCVSAGDFFENTPTWDTTEYKNRVTYNGTSQKNVLLHAICDTGKRMAGRDLPDYCDDYAECYDSEMNLEWFQGCGCISEEFSEMCCLVAVKKAA
ncbi:MAG TPA: hypothetical protein VI977_01605 [archaeon]|nr:hypothetical protein [archaeon]